MNVNRPIVSKNDKAKVKPENVTKVNAEINIMSIVQVDYGNFNYNHVVSCKLDYLCLIKKQFS